jgi:hypothetical protein
MRDGRPVADGTRHETVERLQQQVRVLEARLRGRSGLPSPPEVPAADVRASSAISPRATRLLPDAFAATIGQSAMAGEQPASDREPRRSREARTGATGAPASSGSAAGDAPVLAPTVETALDRFYRYLDAVSGGGGRERWQQARELVNELRGMGDVAAQALMQVLAAGTDSDERRAAARLLGTLQIPDALPALRRVIEQDSDVLLRRAAASGLRQLQTPESLPVMERLLANPAEDRFVRLSAASGLAQANRPLGVAGLAHIFDESTADGRGREIAFRVLASLNDDRALPFMRQVVTSDVEPAYRLRAIRFVTAQGDRQALAGLQVVMHAPNEQPSVRDAAAQAYAALSRQ